MSTQFKRSAVCLMIACMFASSSFAQATTYDSSTLVDTNNNSTSTSTVNTNNTSTSTSTSTSTNNVNTSGTLTNNNNNVMSGSVTYTNNNNNVVSGTTTVNNNNVNSGTMTYNNNNVNTGTMTYNNNNVNTSTSTSNNTNANTNTNYNYGDQTIRNINTTTSNNTNTNVNTSTSTNTNTNNNVNTGDMTNRNINTSTSTSANTNNNNNVSTSNNVNQNIQSGEMTNRNINETTMRVVQPPPTAIAPAMMSGGNNDLCTTGTSGSVQTQIFGVSSGGTVRDMNCERLKLSKTMYDMGMKVAAVATMCQDRRVFDAMMAAGTPCPVEGKIGEQARAYWEANPDKLPKLEEPKADDTYQKVGIGSLLGIAVFKLFGF